MSTKFSKSPTESDGFFVPSNTIGLEVSKPHEIHRFADPIAQWKAFRMPTELRRWWQ